MGKNRYIMKKVCNAHARDFDIKIIVVPLTFYTYLKIMEFINSILRVREKN